MSDDTFAALNYERDLATIPTAQGGLTRLAIARLKSAGVPVAPLLRRAGLTPELVADPEGRLNVRSQVTFLEEAAKALKDDWLGFTLARDFDPREIGLLYYVMASSQTLGDALKRIARYSRVTNEALVFKYQEGNRVSINLSYSGVPRHSDRHQVEFCMFEAWTIPARRMSAPGGRRHTTARQVGRFRPIAAVGGLNVLRCEMHHLITASARPSSVSGKVRPSASAGLGEQRNIATQSMLNPVSLAIGSHF
jgi:hypothetical protein